MMSSDPFIYLAKEYMFQLNSLPSLGHVSKKFKPKEVSLSSGPGSSGGSGYEHALSQYIKERSSDYDLLTFTAKAKRYILDEVDFHVQFNKNFLNILCNIFPNRFIRIRGKIVGSGSLHSITFDERFEINDLLEGFVFEQRLLPSAECKNGNFICDIMVGWSEGIRRIPLKIPHSSSSGDFTLVAANGAEVKCPRDAFDEMVGERFDMKENSEEGIRHLVRYLCDMGLKANELSCDVAVELFKTAGKYKITKLQDSLGQLFLRRTKDWFTPDLLVELYLYAKEENWKSLQDHSLSIMLSSSHEIRNCKRYKELNPVDALDIAWRLCDFSIRRK